VPPHDDAPPPAVPATGGRVSDTSTASERGGSGASDKGKPKPSLFARISLFIRQVIAELRKVIWPTRKELVTYTTVVIIFVLIMAAIVAVLDFAFTRGVLAIFG
jgi:preprotein translocase subunit SecE